MLHQHHNIMFWCRRSFVFVLNLVFAHRLEHLSLRSANSPLSHQFAALRRSAPGLCSSLRRATSSLCRSASQVSRCGDAEDDESRRNKRRTYLRGPAEDDLLKAVPVLSQYKLADGIRASDVAMVHAALGFGGGTQLQTTATQATQTALRAFLNAPLVDVRYGFTQCGAQPMTALQLAVWVSAFRLREVRGLRGREGPYPPGASHVLVVEQVLIIRFLPESSSFHLLHLPHYLSM